MGIPSVSTGLGSSGSPQEASRHERQTSAATGMAKMAMGIVLDSLLLPSFLEINPDLRGYKSDSGRPILPPLSTSRMAKEFLVEEDGKWQPIYEELTLLMPDSFRIFFQQVMQIPVSQRNANITILDAVLQNIARLLVNLRERSLPMVEESIEAFQATSNMVMPYVLLNSLAANSQLLLISGQRYLELVGPNDPNFDNVSGYLGSFNAMASDLQRAAAMLTDSTSEAQGRILLAALTNELIGLSNQFDRLNGNAHFQIFGHLLHVAILSTEALTLKDPGAAPLMIALNNSLYQGQITDTELGITGKALNAFTDATISNLIIASTAKSNAAEKEILKQLASATILFTLLQSSLNYDEMLTHRKETDHSPEAVSERNFAHSLSMTLLTQSGALNALCEIISQQSGSGEQKALKSSLEMILLLTLLMPAIRSSGTQSSSTLSESLSSDLQKAINGTLNGLSEDSISSEMRLYMQQMSIALARGNRDAFYTAFESMLSEMGASRSALAIDVNELKKNGQSVIQSMEGSNNNPATGFDLIV